MNLIKNLIVGYRICHKYNITFYPWRRVSYSEASFQIKNGKYYIWTDIRSPMFIPSLLHELAHCMDYKHTKFRNNINVKVDFARTIRDLGIGTSKYRQILSSEMVANKYAVRFLKSTGMWCQQYQDDLEWAMTTYVSYVDKMDIADYHYNTMKYIRGTV